MGWTFLHRDKGIKAIDFYAHEFGDGRQGGRGVIDCASGMGAAYIAYHLEDGKVMAIVCLQQYKARDYYNFGYKDMSEDMGPCENSCPAKILDQLSPVEDLGLGESGREWAAKWRASCRAKLATGKRPPLKPGMVLHWPTPIVFSSGYQRSDLRVYDAKRLIFSDVDDEAGRYLRFKLRRSSLVGAVVVEG